MPECSHDPLARCSRRFVRVSTVQFTSGSINVDGEPGRLTVRDDAGHSNIGSVDGRVIVRAPTGSKSGVFRNVTNLCVSDKWSIDDLDAKASRREKHVDGDAPI